MSDKKMKDTRPTGIPNLDAVLGGGLPAYGLNILSGPPGSGKTIFLKEGLENGESGPLVNTESSDGLVMDLRDGEGPDTSDHEAFLFGLHRELGTMPEPRRLAVDSLSPMVAELGREGFSAMSQRMIRLLCNRNTALAATLLDGCLSEHDSARLESAFDVVLDLLIPDWGQMPLSGKSGLRALKLLKVRGTPHDKLPYPFALVRGKGVAIQSRFYEQQMEG